MFKRKQKQAPEPTPEPTPVASAMTYRPAGPQAVGCGHVVTIGDTFVQLVFADARQTSLCSSCWTEFGKNYTLATPPRGGIT